MRRTRIALATLAVAGAMAATSFGVAQADSNQEPAPANGPTSGSVEQAPTPGHDEIDLGG